MSRSEWSEEKARLWAGRVVQLSRLKSGMSQRDLAEASGVSPTTIARIETQRMQPTMPLLAKILHGAGLELRTRLAPYDDHDDVLAAAAARMPKHQQALRDGVLDHLWDGANRVD